MSESLSIAPPPLPSEVIAAYDLHREIAAVDPLDGGRVNEAYLLTSLTTQSVIRKLSSQVNPLSINNTRVVSQHLAMHGWEAPAIMPTVDGANYVIDREGTAWHRMRFIESDQATPQKITPPIITAAGLLLGRWHADVRSLDYTPVGGVPHFHDSEFIADKLDRYAPSLPGCALRGLARSLQLQYAKQPAEVTSKQLIHGDPKLGNMLFKNGAPFTLIDFDTLMTDSVWTDVGDFLRSLSGQLISSEPTAILPSIERFVGNYLETAELPLSQDEALYRALRTTHRIATELGMRYLNDIVDGAGYFSVDTTKHASRSQHHGERATVQLAVAEHLTTLMEE